jgi:hypothetical protein
VRTRCEGQRGVHVGASIPLMLGGSWARRRGRGPGVDEVLRLEVAVNDALGVQVLHALQDLYHHGARLALGEVGFLHDAVEQLAAVEVLHHHHQLAVRVVEKVLKLGHAGMLVLSHASPRFRAGPGQRSRLGSSAFMSATASNRSRRPHVSYSRCAELPKRRFRTPWGRKSDGQRATTLTHCCKMRSSLWMALTLWNASALSALVFMTSRSPDHRDTHCRTSLVAPRPINCHACDQPRSPPPQ